MPSDIPRGAHEIVTTNLSGGRAVLFIIDTNKVVWTSEKPEVSDSEWTRWQKFKPSVDRLARSFAACIQPGDKVRVWYINNDNGTVYTTEQKQGASHSEYGTWEEVNLPKENGNPRTAQCIDATKLADGRVQIFCSDYENAYWTKWQYQKDGKGPYIWTSEWTELTAIK